MNNLPFVPLRVGETYGVNDLYGMMHWQGVYKGVLTDENHVEEKDLLLFRIAREPGSGGYLWAGVTPEAELCSEGVRIVLTAYYYGNTPRSLKHANSSRHEQPKWVWA